MTRNAAKWCGIIGVSPKILVRVPMEVYSKERVNQLPLQHPQDCSIDFLVFQAKIFRDLLHHFMIVYIDDIVVYSATMEDQIHHVRIVLKQLQQHKLFAKATETRLLSLNMSSIDQGQKNSKTDTLLSP